MVLEVNGLYIMNSVCNRVDAIELIYSIFTHSEIKINISPKPNISIYKGVWINWLLSLLQIFQPPLFCFIVCSTVNQIRMFHLICDVLAVRVNAHFRRRCIGKWNNPRIVAWLINKYSSATVELQWDLPTQRLMKKRAASYQFDWLSIVIHKRWKTNSDFRTGSVD